MASAPDLGKLIPLATFVVSPWTGIAQGITLVLFGMAAAMSLFVWVNWKFSTMTPSQIRLRLKAAAISALSSALVLCPTAAFAGFNEVMNKYGVETIVGGGIALLIWLLLPRGRALLDLATDIARPVFAHPWSTLVLSTVTLFTTGLIAEVKWLCYFSLPFSLVFWDGIRNRIYISVTLETASLLRQAPVPMYLQFVYGAVIQHARRLFPQRIAQDVLNSIAVNHSGRVPMIVGPGTSDPQVTIDERGAAQSTLDGLIFTFAHEIGHHLKRNHWTHAYYQRFFWAYVAVTGIGTQLAQTYWVYVWGALLGLLAVSRAMLDVAHKRAEYEADAVAVKISCVMQVEPVLAALNAFENAIEEDGGQARRELAAQYPWMYQPNPGAYNGTIDRMKAIAKEATRYPAVSRQDYPLITPTLIEAEKHELYLYIGNIYDGTFDEGQDSYVSLRDRLGGQLQEEVKEEDSSSDVWAKVFEAVAEIVKDEPLREVPIKEEKVEEAAEPKSEFNDSAPAPVWVRPARNLPCPCGSGKKYKNCCFARDISNAGLMSRSFTDRRVDFDGEDIMGMHSNWRPWHETLAAFGLGWIVSLILAPVFEEWELRRRMRRGDHEWAVEILVGHHHEVFSRAREWRVPTWEQKAALRGLFTQNLKRDYWAAVRAHMAFNLKASWQRKEIFAMTSMSLPDILRKARKPMVHMHASGLIFAEDMLPYFAGNSAQAREARRRFAITWNAFTDNGKARAFAAMEVDPQSISQEQADDVFGRAIGPQEYIARDFNNMVLRLQKFTTFAGVKGRQDAASAWAFLFIHALTDSDPALRPRLIKQGIMRVVKEDNVNYFEITDSSSADLRPLLQVAQDVFDATRGMVQVAVLKSFQRDHWVRAEAFRPRWTNFFAGMSLHEVMHVILEHVTAWESKYAALTPQRCANEFGVLVDELTREIDASILKGRFPAEDREDVLKDSIIHAWVARYLASRDIMDFIEQAQHIDEEAPALRRLLVGVTFSWSGRYAYPWIWSSIFRLVRQNGFKAKSHIGKENVYPQLETLRRLKGEISLGISRFIHPQILVQDIAGLSEREAIEVRALRAEIFEEMRHRKILCEVDAGPEAAGIFRVFLEQNIAFSFNTSNRSLSERSLSEEMALLSDALPMLDQHVWDCILCAPRQDAFYEVIDDVIERFAHERRMVKGLEDRPWTVCSFGSARTNDDVPGQRAAYDISRWIWIARKELAAALGVDTISVLSGMGPGIMDAGLRGFLDEQKRSGVSTKTAMVPTYGVRINLNFFEPATPHAQSTIVFDHFVFRKLALFKKSMISAHIGGLGTLDELLEAIRWNVPYVIVGNFWLPVFRAIQASFDEQGLKDDISEAFDCAPLPSPYERPKAIDMLMEKAHRYKHSPDADVEALNQELKKELKKLGALPRPFTVAGDPLSMNGEIDLLRDTVAELLARNISVRVGSRGLVFEAVLDVARQLGKEHLLQFVFYHEADLPWTSEELYVMSRYADHTVVMTNDANYRLALSYDSRGYIFLPGGLKVLNLLFDVMVIIQTRVVRQKPIILIGESFYSRIFDAVALACEGCSPQTITPGDMNLARIVRTPKDALAKLWVNVNGASKSLDEKLQRMLFGLYPWKIAALKRAIAGGDTVLKKFIHDEALKEENGRVMFNGNRAPPLLFVLKHPFVIKLINGQPCLRLASLADLADLWDLARITDDLYNAHRRYPYTLQMAAAYHALHNLDGLTCAGILSGGFSQPRDPDEPMAVSSQWRRWYDRLDWPGLRWLARTIPFIIAPIMETRELRDMARLDTPQLAASRMVWHHTSVLTHERGWHKPSLEEKRFLYQFFLGNLKLPFWQAALAHRAHNIKAYHTRSMPYAMADGKDAFAKALSGRPEARAAGKVFIAGDAVIVQQPSSRRQAVYYSIWDAVRGQLDMVISEKTCAARVAVNIAMLEQGWCFLGNGAPAKDIGTADSFLETVESDLARARADGNRAALTLVREARRVLEKAPVRKSSLRESRSLVVAAVKHLKERQQEIARILDCNIGVMDQSLRIAYGLGPEVRTGLFREMFRLLEGRTRTLMAYLDNIEAMLRRDAVQAAQVLVSMDLQKEPWVMLLREPQALGLATALDRVRVLLDAGKSDGALLLLRALRGRVVRHAFYFDVTQDYARRLAGLALTIDLEFENRDIDREVVLRRVFDEHVRPLPEHERELYWGRLRQMVFTPRWIKSKENIFVENPVFVSAEAALEQLKRAPQVAGQGFCGNVSQEMRRAFEMAFNADQIQPFFIKKFDALTVRDAQLKKDVVVSFAGFDPLLFTEAVAKGVLKDLSETSIFTVNRREDGGFTVFLAEAAVRKFNELFTDHDERRMALVSIALHELAELNGKSHAAAELAQTQAPQYERVQARLEMLQQDEIVIRPLAHNDVHKNVQGYVVIDHCCGLREDNVTFAMAIRNLGYIDRMVNSLVQSRWRCLFTISSNKLEKALDSVIAAMLARQDEFSPQMSIQQLFESAISKEVKDVLNEWGVDAAGKLVRVDAQQITVLDLMRNALDTDDGLWVIPAIGDVDGKYKEEQARQEKLQQIVAGAFCRSIDRIDPTRVDMFQMYFEDALGKGRDGASAPEWAENAIHRAMKLCLENIAEGERKIAQERAKLAQPGTDVARVHVQIDFIQKAILSFQVEIYRVFEDLLEELLVGYDYQNPLIRDGVAALLVSARIKAMEGVLVDFTPKFNRDPQGEKERLILLTHAQGAGYIRRAQESFGQLLARQSGHLSMRRVLDEAVAASLEDFKEGDLQEFTALYRDDYAARGIVKKEDALYGMIMGERRRQFEDIADELFAQVELSLKRSTSDEETSYTVLAIDRIPTPSHFQVFVDLYGTNLKAVVSSVGSAGSHFSLFAKSLNIPVFIVDPQAFTRLRAHDDVLVLDSRILVNPQQKSRDLVTRLDLLQEQYQESCRHIAQGVDVYVAANADRVATVREAFERYGAATIGLARTENMFAGIVPMLFKEMLVFFQDLLAVTGGKKITFRVIDWQPDKRPLSWAHAAYEGEKWYLEHPLGRAVARQQLRVWFILSERLKALERLWDKQDAGSLRVMFPMIETAQDLIAAEALLKDMILAEGFPEWVKLFRLGSMIETPGAVDELDPILDLTSFLSVGTNDLTAKLYRVDRANPEASRKFYTAVRPLLIRTIGRILHKSKNTDPLNVLGDVMKRRVSICGDLASMRRFWLVWEYWRRQGLKLDLSMPGPKIPEFKAWSVVMASGKIYAVEEAMYAIERVMRADEGKITFKASQTGSVDQRLTDWLDVRLVAAQEAVEEYLHTYVGEKLPPMNFPARMKTAYISGQRADVLINDRQMRLIEKLLARMGESVPPGARAPLFRLSPSLTTPGQYDPYGRAVRLHARAFDWPRCVLMVTLKEEMLHYRGLSDRQTRTALATWIREQAWFERYVDFSRDNQWMRADQDWQDIIEAMLPARRNLPVRALMPVNDRAQELAVTIAWLRAVAKVLPPKSLRRVGLRVWRPMVAFIFMPRRGNVPPFTAFVPCMALAPGREAAASGYVSGTRAGKRPQAGTQVLTVTRAIKPKGGMIIVAVLITATGAAARLTRARVLLTGALPYERQMSRISPMASLVFMFRVGFRAVFPAGRPSTAKSAALRLPRPGIFTAADIVPAAITPMIVEVRTRPSEETLHRRFFVRLPRAAATDFDAGYRFLAYRDHHFVYVEPSRTFGFMIRYLPVESRALYTASGPRTYPVFLGGFLYTPYFSGLFWNRLLL